MKQYIIKDIVGSNCITAESGQKIYDLMNPALSVREEVKLNFDGVHIFASLFFNMAIGRLYEDYSGEELNTFLKIEGLNSDGHEILKRVVENSKAYYSDKSIQQIQDDVLKEHMEDN